MLRGIIPLINILNAFETNSPLKLTQSVALKSGLYTELRRDCRVVSATADAFEEDSPSRREKCYTATSPIDFPGHATSSQSQQQGALLPSYHVFLLIDIHLGKVVIRRSKQFKVLMLGE